MKGKHWIVLGVIVVGILFLFHNWQMHGGYPGVKSGLGLGNFGLGRSSSPGGSGGY